MCARENVEFKQKDGTKRCSGIKIRQGYNYRLAAGYYSGSMSRKLSSVAEFFFCIFMKFAKVQLKLLPEGQQERKTFYFLQFDI